MTYMELVDLLKYVNAGMCKEELVAAMRLHPDRLDELITHATSRNLLAMEDSTPLLSESGKNLLREEKYDVLPIDQKINSRIFEKAEDVCEFRVEPDISIEQHPITYAGLAKRIAFMHHNGDISHKSLLCIGDNDGVSLLAAEIGKPEEICVIDIDQRILNRIKKIARERDYPIEVIEYDVRKMMKKEYPESLENRFDVFECDPPVTMTAMQLYLGLGNVCLKKERESSAYVSISRMKGVDWMMDNYHAFQSFLINNGFIITDVSSGYTFEGTPAICDFVKAERAFPRDFTYIESLDLENFYLRDPLKIPDLLTKEQIPAFIEYFEKLGTEKQK